MKQTALDQLKTTVEHLKIGLLIAQTIKRKLPRTYYLKQSGWAQYTIEHDNNSTILTINNQTTNIGGIETNLSDPDCITKTIKAITNMLCLQEKHSKPS